MATSSAMAYAQHKINKSVAWIRQFGRDVDPDLGLAYRQAAVGITVITHTAIGI